MIIFSALIYLLTYHTYIAYKVLLENTDILLKSCFFSLTSCFRMTLTCFYTSQEGASVRVCVSASSPPSALKYQFLCVCGCTQLILMYSFLMCVSPPDKHTHPSHRFTARKHTCSYIIADRPPTFTTTDTLVQDIPCFLLKR